jgi:hypothetical protein
VKAHKIWMLTRCISWRPGRRSRGKPFLATLVFLGDVLDDPYRKRAEKQGEQSLQMVQPPQPTVVIAASLSLKKHPVGLHPQDIRNN